jgi:hypothetical protein
MKKAFSLLIVLLMVCLCACNVPQSNSAETTVPTMSPEANTEASVLPETQPPETAPADTSTATEPQPTEPSTTAPAELTELPLPSETVEFSFLSGAGGWWTSLILHTDGSFVGSFHDSEMGDIGEGYPHGSVYVCNFSGRFIAFEQINDYAYKMTLTDVSTEHQTGEEWIEDDIRYVAYDPYGIEEGTEFILYLPDTPLSEVPEEFLTWWPYRYDQSTEPKENLSCYGILNVATNYGFFYLE